MANLNFTVSMNNEASINSEAKRDNEPRQKNAANMNNEAENTSEDSKINNENNVATSGSGNCDSVATKRVLFVCSHNSNRSIAAHVIARQLRRDLHVESAGTMAAGTLNPNMLKALEARGYNTEGMFSKGIDHPAVQGLHNNWDLICTMGCLQKGLPYDPLPETQVEDWGLPDPAAFPELLESVVDTVVEKVQSIRL